MTDTNREESANSILRGLNGKQREAVTTTEGPVLVIAGPGSGKTRALTHRVAYLVATGVRAHEILAVTFTNKAAEEMRQRVHKLLSFKVSKLPDREPFKLTNLKTYELDRLPFIGTFHSFAASLLRAHAGKIDRTRHFTIYDEGDRLAMVKTIMKELNVSSRAYPPGMIIALISSLKNDLIAGETYAASADEPFSRTVARVYETYQKRLGLSNALDFDDLLFFAVRLLQNHPPVLAGYQERLGYIHIDEFQDANPIQYELMKLLAEKHHNIFAIGDDSQSIYSWRQADPGLMLEFEKDFPGTSIILLEENYRSTPQILEAANHIIRQNREQKEKTLFTANPAGELPRVIAHADEREEAEFIAEEIQRLHDAEGIPWRGFSILYRVNAQSRALEEAMIANGIPYAILGGIRFFERREVKDLVAYLRAVVNPKDRQAIGRIANVPPRGIGPKTLLAFLNGQVSRLPAKDREKLHRFQRLMAELRKEGGNGTLSNFLRRLIKETRYEDYLADGTPSSESRIENIRELVSLARKYDALDAAAAIGKLLEEIALMSEQDELKNHEDRVRLMTVHSSKGLEFPVVFIAGLEEGIFPHQKSLSASRALLEEERRLCYVGMTRAKHRLYLTWAGSRLLFGERERLIPSRFLRELPPEISKPVREVLEEMEETLYAEE